MKRRVKVILSFFVLLCGAGLGICCIIFDFPLGVRVIDVVIMAVAMTLLKQITTCPFCGKVGLSARPFSKRKVFCKKCGKEMIGKEYEGGSL